MLDMLPGLDAVVQAAVVVAAFSALVFVHELGHYLAARLAGVRVERFFVGFDIYGLGLSTTYRGTVYGIGLLPLGGYCALAGQNDDPRKEIRTGAPDELQSKSLGARALVFAGGVLLNFAFGFVVLVAAYMYGIPFIPAVLGEIDPAGPAAAYGFKSGDRILSVDGKPMESFEDAVEAVALAGAGSEVEFTIERREDPAGSPEVMRLRVKGAASDMRGGLNSINADPPRSRLVAGLIEDKSFGELREKLAVGDEILAVNGRELQPNKGELLGKMLENVPGERADLTVRRPDGRVETVNVPLETYGEWDIGLRTGIVLARVLPGGPADHAGLRAGDVVIACERKDDRDPRYFGAIRELQEMVAGTSLRPLAVSFLRDGTEMSAVVRPFPSDGAADPGDDPLLGISGRFDGPEFVVEATHPGPEASEAFEPGDRITALAGRPLDLGKSMREMVEDRSSEPLTLYVARRLAEGEPPNPGAGEKVPGANITVSLVARMTPAYRRPMIGVDLAPGPVTAVEPGSFADRELGGTEKLRGAMLGALHFSPDLRSVTLWFLFPESSPFGGGTRILVAETPAHIRADPLAAGLRHRLPISLKTSEETNPLPFGRALAAAGKRWVSLALMVYNVIHKLIVQAIPIEAVGGPVKLFHIIKIADDRGFAYFLYIVALISVNLGVCNLLPFPVLDGGHLLFLGIEKIMGRPPSPLIREGAQWIGLVCLLALMLTVTGYDLLHLFRGTG